VNISEHKFPVNILVNCPGKIKTTREAAPTTLKSYLERKTRSKLEPCFSWLNPGQIVIHREAFGPLQPAVVGILNNDLRNLRTAIQLQLDFHVFVR